jgi:hypothetical protein
MSITPNDAATALGEIERTQFRSARSLAYRIASPHLILWGVIWAVGYALMGVLPVESWWKIWLPADLLGFLGSLWLGLRRAREGGAQAARGDALRGLGIGVLIGVVLVVVFSLFQPARKELFELLPAVFTGAIYTGIGLFRLPRFLWLGGWIFASALIGYLVLQPWLAFWIAGAGGGALILGGFWLRKV